MESDKFVSLDIETPFWKRVFVVAPLVVVGTKEGEDYNLAPKHMAMPLGWENYFGFICTPAHGTYHNAKRHGAFTVSYPWPNSVTVASLTASPRQEDSGCGTDQPILDQIPTTDASLVDSIFLRDAYLRLECELDRIVDDFGDQSLIIGRIVAVHVHEEALRTSDQEDQQLIYDAPLLAYLHPGRFATIRESQTFPFPEHFTS
jgi:flavin reductase (DIM6/NTAB) family NADH-FMN oxidoreductase RutF